MRAATGSFTCRPTPTCASAWSVRATTSNRTRSRPRTSSRRCARPASSRSRSPRPAPSTASRTSSRHPRTRRSRSRPRSTARPSSPGEGLIARVRAGYGFTGLIFRFVSILGERYTHGHVFDFYRALQRDPDAPARARRRPSGEVLPLRRRLRRRDPRPPSTRTTTRRARTSTTSAPTRRIVVDDSVAIIIAHMGLAPEIEHTGGRRGWTGDSPLIHLDCAPHPCARLGVRRSPSARLIVRTLRLVRRERLCLDVTAGSELEREVARHERDLQPRAAAHLAGRRRDRPALLLRGARRLPRLRRDRQVRLHAHPHRLPAALPDEVLGDSRRSTTVAEIRHPILREALLAHWRGNPLEIASVADVPAGTGMGSSGAFTVCLLKALAHARRTSITPGALAEDACEIEIDMLGEPVGKQDPYVAAHGGICAYTFHPRRHRRRRAARARAEHAAAAARSAAPVLHRGGALGLGRARRPGRALDGRATRRCSRTCTGPRSWATAAGDLLLAGDLDAYAELMHEHWEHKRDALPGHDRRAHRPSLHARPAKRRARRQAGRRRRGRFPARLCAHAPRTRARRWPPQAPPSSSSTSSSRGAYASEYA